MASVIFCSPCGEKRVKEVKDKLQALLNSSSKGDNHCFICDKEITSANLKSTDDNKNNLSTGQPINKDDNDFVTVNLNKPEIKIEILDDSYDQNKSALEPVHDPEKKSRHLGRRSKFKGFYVKKEEISDSEDDQNERIGDSDETYEEDVDDGSDDDDNGGDDVDDTDDAKSRGTKGKTTLLDTVNAFKVNALQPELSKMLEIVDDPQKPYKCKECTQKSRQLSSILRHFSKHIGESQQILKFYQCNKCCDKQFSNFLEWTDHTKQFICKYPSCGIVKKSRTFLTKHEKIHKKEGIKLFKCKICGDEYSSYYKLNGHQHKAHAGVKYKPAVVKKKLRVRKKKDSKSDRSKWTANAIEDREIKISSVKPDVLKLVLDESYEGIGFKCKFCDKANGKMGLFLAHASEHVDDKLPFDKPYQCKSCCDKTFKTYLEWAWHTKPYKCEVEGCKRRVERRSRLRHHFKRTHTEKRFACTECPKMFKHQHNLNDHMKSVHLGTKDFTCIICGKQYATRSSMRDHERKHKYKNTKPFKCDVTDCERVFSSNQLLKIHKMDHTGERPYQCEQCGFRTKTKQDLRDHQYRHSDYKPYTCEICGKKMTGQSWYKRHMQIHTGAKMLKCRYCDERFKYPDSRARHERVHPESKGTKFVCNICGKDMITKAKLERHTRIHTGEKPFQCALCEFRTNRPESLKTHQKQHSKAGYNFKVIKSHTKTLNVRNTDGQNDTRREEFVITDVHDIHTQRRNLALQGDMDAIHDAERRNLALQHDVNVIHDAERRNLALQDDVNAIRDAERRNMVLHEFAAISEAQIASAYIML